jgi:hypothetical protein
LVVRPRRRPRDSYAGRTAAAAFPLLAAALYSLQFEGWIRVVVVCIGISLAGVIIGAISLSYRRTKLTLVGGQVIFTGLWRDRVVLPKGQAGRVVDVDVAWRDPSGRRSRLWLIVNGRGRTAIGLNRDAWDGGELERVRESLGLPIEVVEAPKRPAEVRRAYPGIIPWWAAHTTVATVLAIFALSALVLALERLAA